MSCSYFCLTLASLWYLQMFCMMNGIVSQCITEIFVRRCTCAVYRFAFWNIKLKGKACVWKTSSKSNWTRSLSSVTKKKYSEIPVWMLLLIYIFLPFLRTLITAQKQLWEHHICTAFLQSWRWISPKEANYIWKYFYMERLPSNSNQKESKYRYKNKTITFSSFPHQTLWYRSGAPHEDLRRRKK